MLDFSDSRIEYWAQLLQDDYGYCYAETVDRWRHLIKNAYYVEDADEYFLVLTLQSHLKLHDTLNVGIFYVKPEYRKNPKYLLHIEKLIDIIAKKAKVKYIIQGSHTNARLADFLEKIGYKPFLMRKEI